jgi:5-methylcytosine-specific restriction endonuclease McrA
VPSEKPTASWRQDRRKTAERGYGARWQRTRLHFLRENPACIMCKPRLVPATVVDHIKPHRGDQSLFWDPANWQALCKLHHDSEKAELERSGTVRGVDAGGVPLDPNHPWAKNPTTG